MSATVKSLQQLWDTFNQQVLPTDASAVQRQETRRAFYAGCWGIINMMVAAAASDISEEEGVRLLENWRAEGLRFQSRVGTPYEKERTDIGTAY